MASSMTGEEIQALAYARAPIKPADLGIAINTLSYTLLILSTIVIVARVWVWLRMNKDGNQRWSDSIHDYFAVLGYLMFVPAVALCITSTYYGMGARDDKVDELLKIRVAEYFIDFEIVYYFASTLTKFAIAFTTLRICVQRVYYWIIIANVCVMTAVMVFCLGLGLGNCTPLAATWNPLLGHCWWSQGFIFVSYFGSAFQVITDWVSALVPALIIMNLNMRRRLKVSLVCVLSVGSLASIAVTVRMFYYRYFDVKAYPDNYLFHLGITLLLSLSECGLGIIACSLPPLHKLFYRFYGASRVRPSARSGEFELGRRAKNSAQPLSSTTERFTPSKYNDASLLRTEIYPDSAGSDNHPPSSGNAIYRQTRIDVVEEGGGDGGAVVDHREQHPYIAEWAETGVSGRGRGEHNKPLGFVGATVGCEKR